MTHPVRLADFVKSYDIRGLVGSQLTEEVVAAVGAAFVDELGAAGSSVLVGHDMRDSSPAFAAAFARGAQSRGADVVSLGLCSTDESYYASGALKLPAAMFTASHNPATYNGIKLSRAGAQAISIDTGLGAVRDRAQVYLDEGLTALDGEGGESVRNVLPDYAAYLRSLVDLSGIRPLKVVVDAGNGMGGLTVPAVLGAAAGLDELPLEIIPLYFELDGTFPNHEANPLDPANLVDLQAAVVEHGADLGLAFDGDADRCFVVDERGNPVTPSTVTAIVALREIARIRTTDPDADIAIIHNLLVSRAVPETIEEAGATPIRTRVGHSLIKDRMRETGALFGGEHSAHYYFRDFWGADNGMLAAMHVLAEFGAQQQPLSAFAERFDPYTQSGEINSVVDDVPAAYARIVESFAHEGEFDELDGLTVSGQDGQDWWWFTVRPSNTEPYLRLNAEARTAATLERLRDRVLGLIRQD
ncbi:phosphomannomutase/phosphoglucomutase [Schumannella soli]|uniref:Phosphomannomutase/phosphoglucomutase n=1 Tax=Schumannella soli TaxID=2590779 RepID=A0A506Y3R8_9MICO|nr:phosphomannomutase/phosphoglucomutase [Schumannella soli]TPW77216.1 phosphomannomutase/phosphoglucomutase [Schumannella soli]